MPPSRAPSSTRARVPTPPRWAPSHRLSPGACAWRELLIASLGMLPGKRLVSTLPLLAVAAGFVLVGPSVGPAPTASAASCTTVPTFFAEGDTAGVEGGTCKDIADVTERLSVYCSASPKISVSYAVDPDPA